MTRATASRPPAARRVVVAAGAAERLAAAAAWLAALPRDAEALVVAAHGHAADELVRAVAAADGARFGLHRFTPARLAARLAAPALAARGFTPGTALSLAAVAARATHQVLAAGGAGRFEAVARRPGFPHAVARTYADLRAARVGGARLRAALPWGSDLGALADGIALELERMKVADRALVFELAAAAVRDGAAALPAAPLLLLDLPLDGEPERALIAALAGRAPALLATAPRGDGVALAALARLGAIEERAGRDGARALDRLQRHLFEEAAPDPAPPDDSVELRSWPGEARECVEIARAIVKEAEGGTPFDRIAILLRAPGAYRAHVAEALRRAAVPAWFARGTTRPDPAGRALLALLACAADNLSARRFAEYLSLAQVPEPGDAGESWSPPAHDLMPLAPESLAAAPEPTPGPAPQDLFDPAAATVEGTLRAPWRWERLLVDAAVIGGADRWRRRLAGLAAELALRRGELDGNDARLAALDRTRADLGHLSDFALPVIERLAALPAAATWAVWLERLRDLATAAIRQPAGVLAVLAELEPLAPVGPVDLAVVQHVLDPRLGDLTVAPAARPHGAVFVAPVEMARGLAFDVVFVPGLAEKLFPQRILEDPLLPDAARRALDPGALATGDARVAAERLLLRIAAGAATRRLVLSWPRVDVENARPRVPSFYGLEAVRAAEGRLPGFDELRARAESVGFARLGWPAPDDPEQAVDDTEYDLAVLARLKGDQSAATTGAAAYLLAANPHLARALRARARRWLKRWTPADGLVEPGPAALAALARHRMGARSFSPTALENFAACPYRFLLQAIHRLQPRDEIEALETIDPLTRGALFHEVQFRLLTGLRGRGALPLDPSRLGAAIEQLDAAVAAVAEEYRERLAPAIPRVWEDGVAAIRADLREWLRRAALAGDGWVPHRFEMSFGLAGHARPTADAASVPDPVPIAGGALLRGSIDLVERRADGALRVTDHKTGKARVPEDAVVAGGQALQPVLYALAAEALLAAPVEGGRLYYCTADGDFAERVIPLDEVSRRHAATAIGVVGRAIETGFLPAVPLEDACRFCDYRPVCGPHEYDRTRRKPREPLADLDALRGLP